MTGRQVHFIVPFRSPEVTKDWETTKDLLSGTLQALENQSSSRYTIQLVAHVVPECVHQYSNLNVIKVDYPIPTTKKEMMVDKGRKVRTGTGAAPKGEGDFFMVLDADDRVHYRLVQHVVQDDYSDLIYIEKGYIWPYGRHFCLKWPNFYEACGSSHLVRYDGSNIPNGVEDAKDYVFTSSHTNTKKIAERKGLNVTPLSFPGCTYITDVSDNHSGISMTKYLHKKRFLKKVFRLRPLTPSIRKSFAI